MAVEIGTVLTFDDDKIPIEGTPEFRENASYVWSQINPVLKSFNAATAVINESYSDMENFRDETENFRDETENFRDETKTYRDDAIEAKEVIENYVIPEEATLSEDAINDLLDEKAQLDGDNTQVFKASTAVEDDEVVSLGQLTKSIGNINNPLLDLPLNNSLSMKQGVGSVDFTRSTTATYIDRYGVLQYANTDEPRFEKDGLLVEGSSTNLCLGSSKITSDYFSLGSDGSLTEDYTSIDGDTNAALLSSSVDGDTYFYCFQGNTMSVGDIFTTSVIVDTKNMTDGTYCRITAHTSVTNADNHSYIGVYKDGSEYFYDPDGVILNYKIEHIVDTTYRLQLTTTVGDVNGDGSDVSSNYYFLIYVINATDLGDGVIFSFPQVEKLSFATSYIPTDDAAVTRDADACSIYNIGGNFNPSEFSLSADVKHLEFTDNQFFLSLNNEDNISIFGLYENDGPDSMYGLKEDGYRGINTVDSSGLCTRYSDGDVMNEYLLDYVFTEVYRLNIGFRQTLFDGSFGMLFGHIKNVRIWDKCLTQTEARLA